LHAILTYRGSKTSGGGTEWFKTTRDEIVSLYKLIKERRVSGSISRAG
jgi:hypothetical protein